MRPPQIRSKRSSRRSERRDYFKRATPSFPSFGGGGTTTSSRRRQPAAAAASTTTYEDDDDHARRRMMMMSPTTANDSVSCLTDPTHQYETMANDRENHHTMTTPTAAAAAATTTGGTTAKSKSKTTKKTRFISRRRRPRGDHHDDEDDDDSEEELLRHQRDTTTTRTTTGTTTNGTTTNGTTTTTSAATTATTAAATLPLPSLSLQERVQRRARRQLERFGRVASKFPVSSSSQRAARSKKPQRTATAATATKRTKKGGYYYNYRSESSCSNTHHNKRTTIVGNNGRDEEGDDDGSSGDDGSESDDYFAGASSSRRTLGHAFTQASAAASTTAATTTADKNNSRHRKKNAPIAIQSAPPPTPSSSDDDDHDADHDDDDHDDADPDDGDDADHDDDDHDADHDDHDDDDRGADHDDDDDHDAEHDPSDDDDDDDDDDDEGDEGDDYYPNPLSDRGLSEYRQDCEALDSDRDDHRHHQEEKRDRSHSSSLTTKAPPAKKTASPTTSSRGHAKKSSSYETRSSVDQDDEELLEEVDEDISRSSTGTEEEDEDIVSESSLVLSLKKGRPQECTTSPGGTSFSSSGTGSGSGSNINHSDDDDDDEEDDDEDGGGDDPCIMSVEPASPHAGSDTTSKETKSKGYIINEPGGSIVDKFVDYNGSVNDDDGQPASLLLKSPAKTSWILKSRSEGSNNHNNGTAAPVFKKQSSTDGLASTFSVEPLSPMSEISDTHHRAGGATTASLSSKASGIMGMLEQCLPDDVSNGPMNVVFDQYIPSFASSSHSNSAETSVENTPSVGMLSNSSTSHPLRFVNELRVGGHFSEEAGNNRSKRSSFKQQQAPQENNHKTSASHPLRFVKELRVGGHFLEEAGNNKSKRSSFKQQQAQQENKRNRLSSKKEEEEEQQQQQQQAYHEKYRKVGHSTSMTTVTTADGVSSKKKQQQAYHEKYRKVGYSTSMTTVTTADGVSSKKEQQQQQQQQQQAYHEKYRKVGYSTSMTTVTTADGEGIEVTNCDAFTIDQRTETDQSNCKDNDNLLSLPGGSLNSEDGLRSNGESQDDNNNNNNNLLLLPGGSLDPQDDLRSNGKFQNNNSDKNQMLLPGGSPAPQDDSFSYGGTSRDEENDNQLLLSGGSRVPPQRHEENITNNNLSFPDGKSPRDQQAQFENYPTVNVCKQHLTQVYTSIQIISPKYRGWKPEELEVILLEAKKLDNNHNLETLPTAETDACSSNASDARELESQVARSHKDDTATQQSCDGATSFSSNLHKDDTATQQSCDGATSFSSNFSIPPIAATPLSSNFSIPPIAATLSYDTEDSIAIPPAGTLVDSDDTIYEYHSECTDEQSTQNDKNWKAKELDPRNLSGTHFSFNSSSSHKRAPGSIRHHPGGAAAAGSGRHVTKPLITLKRPHFRQRSDSPGNLNLVIRSTKSEELPLGHQAQSYLDTIEEQIEPNTPVDDSGETENKENQSSSSTDFWQSSLDSLRQLKATNGSQRQLLTRLIAERNGANATASTAKTKLTQWSEKYRDTLSSKDLEIEGLRQANQLLRIQVAQVNAARIPVNDTSHERTMAELNRKLQDLNANGAVVDKRAVDKDAKRRDRLYRSERTTSSDFVEIDKCMFELTTKEVTTLQVCKKQPPSKEGESRDDEPKSADHEIQVAISKIVAKETAFLRQQVESLARQLDEEKSKNINSSAAQDCDAPKGVVEKNCDANFKSSREDPSGEKETAVAKWKSEPNQREALAKRLEKAQSEIQKVSSEKENLAKALQESRSSSQDYRDKLVLLEKEASSLRESSKKNIEHLETTLHYYKRKVLAMEAEASKSDSRKMAVDHGKPDPPRNEIASLRDLVDSLQRDYAEAECRRVQAAAKYEAMELDLKRTKRDLESRILDNEDLLRKTEELFAAKSDCDERILLLESNRINSQYGDSESELLFEKDAYLQHYKRSVDKLEAEISSLRENEKRAAETTRVEIVSLRELVERFRHDHEVAVRDRDETADKYQALRKQYERSEHELQIRQQEIQTLTSRADQLHSAKEECEKKILSLETTAIQLRLETTKQSLQSGGNEEILKMKVFKLEKEVAAVKERELQTSKEVATKTKMLQDRLSSLQNKVSAVSKERDEASEKAKRDVTACEKRISILQDEVTDLTKERDEAISEIKSASEKGKKDVTVCEERISSLQVAVADLTKERDQAISESKTVSSDLARIMLEYKKSIEEKEKLACEVQQLLVTKEDYGGRLDNLRAELSEALDDRKRSSKEMAECIGQYKRQVASMKEKLKELKDRESTSAEDAQKVIASYEDRVAKLQSDLEREISAKHEANNAITLHEEYISTMQKDIIRLKNERDEASSTSQRLSLDLEQVKRDLDSRILDNTELSLRVEQLFAAKEEYEEMIARTEAEKVGLDNRDEELMMSQMRITTLESELDELHELLKTQQGVLQDPTFQDNRDEELMMSQMQIATLESEIDELRELLKTQPEISRAPALQDNRDEELMMSQMRIATLESELDELRELLKTQPEISQDPALQDKRDEELMMSQMRIATLESELDELRELSKTSQKVSEDPTFKDDRGEECMMYQMQIATLEGELDELHELSKTQQEVSFKDDMSSDIHALNWAKQEALAKCAFLSRENEKIADMLDTTRTELSETIIQVSRLEMDLDDALNEEMQTNRPCEQCKNAKRSEERIKALSDQNSCLYKELEQTKSLSQELQEKVERFERLQTYFKKKNDEEKVAANQRYIAEKEDFLKKLRVLEQESRKREKAVSAEKEDLLKKLQVLEQESHERENLVSALLDEKHDLSDKVKLLEKDALVLKQEWHEREKAVTILQEEKQNLSEKVKLLEKAALDNAKSISEKEDLLAKIQVLRQKSQEQEKAVSVLLNEKQDLSEKVKLLEKEALDTAKADLSSASEKKALMDEIRRLEELQTTAEKKIAQVQVALDSAREEAAHLQGILVLKEAQERAQPFYSSGSDAVHLRRRISELELQLQTAENSSRSTEAKYKSDEQEREVLLAQLRQVEARAATAEKEASHFRLQLSDMEKQLCSAEDTLNDEQLETQRLSEQLQCVEMDLKSKQKEIDDITLQLKTARSQERARALATAHKPPDNDGAEKNKDTGNLKITEDKRLESLTNALAASQENEAQLIQAMALSQKRDRNELLVLRQQVANLQNDILAAEEARKKISDENQALLEKQEEASSIHEEESDTKHLSDSQDKVSTHKYADQDTQALSSQLAETLAALDEKKDRINHLEDELKRAFSDQGEFADTVAFLKQELASLLRSRNEKEDADAKERNGRDSINDDAKDDNEKDCRISHLEDCLERVSADKEQFMAEIQQLKQELGALKGKSNSVQLVVPHKTPRPVKTIAKHDHTSSSSTRNAGSIKALFDDTADDTESLGGVIGASLSDMSVTSKMAMSVASNATLSNVVKKHTLYAQKLNEHLGLVREREEEVYRTVTRKVSLLQKEISKLNGSSSNYTGSFEERTALSGSLRRSLSGDSQTLEFDLECRLADVAQLESMLDVLVADKRKSEQKVKALYEANKEYLNEVKELIDEKDEIVQQQEEVIDTLCHEMAELRKRERNESRTLIREISLLEENILHLREQHDQAERIIEQAEHRLEIALKERQSLEVGLKQIRSEKEHCLKRLPKLNRTLSSFQEEMEERIAKLKSSTYCSEYKDQQLLADAEKLKLSIENIFKYAEAKKRKGLRLQTIKSSSSDTGEAEYFVTLNDYEYQLASEVPHAASNEVQKNAIKAAAASEHRFNC